VLDLLGINPLKADEMFFMALVRTFDESPLLYKGGSSPEELVAWLQKHELPVVMDVKEKTVDLLFSGDKSAVILFVADKAES
jgi:hypothetical protein